MVRCNEKSLEINNMSMDDLNNKLKDLKSELFNLRFQNATNQLENPMRIRAVKKDIARVLTVINKNKINQTIEA